MHGRVVREGEVQSTPLAETQELGLRGTVGCSVCKSTRGVYAHKRFMCYTPNCPNEKKILKPFGSKATPHTILVREEKHG